MNLKGTGLFVLLCICAGATYWMITQTQQPFENGWTIALCTATGLLSWLWIEGALWPTQQ